MTWKLLKIETISQTFEMKSNNEIKSLNIEMTNYNFDKNSDECDCQSYEEWVKILK